MDVRCDQCGIIYEFEDGRVSETGITVKCTSCGHIFQIFKHAAKTAAPVPKPVAIKPLPAGPEAPAPAKKEADKRWLIRKPSGEIFKFRELTTLQQWIVEQKVSREDEISRTGKVWERLGAIKELAPFFQVVDKALAKDSAAPPPEPTSPPLVAEPELPLQKQAPARPDLLEERVEPEGGPAPVEALEGQSEKYAMGATLPAAPEEPQFPTGKIDLDAAKGGQRAAFEEIDRVKIKRSAGQIDTGRSCRLYPHAWKLFP